MPSPAPRTPPRIRTIAAAIALGAAALAPSLSSAGAAQAQAQAAENVVSIAATPGSAFFVTDCKGQSRTNVTSVIRVAVSRSGDTTSPITVALAFSGPLAATIGLPSEATIAAGASQVVLDAAEHQSGEVTVTLLDGDGYSLGSPSAARAGVSQGVADLGCGIGNPYHEQTIEVGTTPADIDVVAVAYGPPASLDRSVEGTIPPGTTFYLDGTWDGVATEVGDYAFREYFCDDEGWCPYRADLRVIVVPAGEQPQGGGTPTPAPQPVPARAVAAVPALTG